MNDHVEPQKPHHPSARSGEHPAVKAYRDKLESVDKGGSEAVSALDRELQQFLDDLKTPVPPKPES